MPCQLVKRLSFGVSFPRNNSRVLFPGDGAFVFKANDRPLSFKNNRQEKPGHIYTEIMQAPEKDICRDRASLKDFQESLRLGFDYDLG